MSRFLKSMALTVGVVSLSVMGLVTFYSASLPNSYYVENSNISVSSVFPISSKPCKQKVRYASQAGENSNGIEKISQSTLMLFNSVPIKDVEEKTVERPMLIPGGQAFGIKLLTEGVVVVKTQKLNGQSPAAECGIQVGDVVLSVNGKDVGSNQEISDAISSSKGEPCTVVFKHDNEEHTATLKPVYYDGSYKAGMWVRDSSAGIGTITFYDPETMVFGGLGHPICDSDTKQPLPISEGSVCDVSINGCNKSVEGTPGQLEGTFTSDNKKGDIHLNDSSGVFGHINCAPANQTAIPMGFRQEVHKGKAEILCTLNGKQTKKYTIEIEKVNLSEKAQHDMVIKVTDKELLEQTGGIVQGMSGSPIIQDGRLVGAVTHVFVDNPQEGYGIFADSMYTTSQNCQMLTDKKAG
ncbi:MAG: SpoIVB peptidase [Oscillospiraceae bacterium]